MHARTSAHASFSSRNGNVAIVAGYVQEASTWVTQRHRFYKRIVHRSLTLVGGGNLLPILVGPGTTMEDQRRRDPCIGGVDNTVRNACLQLRCNHKGLIVQNAGSLKRQGFRQLQRRQIHFFSLRITGFDCSTPVVDRRRAFTVSRGTRRRSAPARVSDSLARPRGGRKPPGNGAPLRRHDSARRPAILRRHPVILIGNQTMRSARTLLFHLSALKAIGPRKAILLMKQLRVQQLLVVLFIFVVFWHGFSAGAPRADQLAYLHQVSLYTTLHDILKYAPDWNRTHSAGDTALYRPVLYFLLGLEYGCFGYNFMLWQALAIGLHGLIALVLLATLWKTPLQGTGWPLLVTCLFAGSFLPSELVIWNHITGYVLFCLLISLSVYTLVEFFETIE